ncbi:phage tail protein [Burkholderia stagnalis]|uniref:Phage tail protein n=1 Tax=Burkholderia stagnalis TaxID=1503054 RepID=A0ABX9YF29_9BURK|nr:phage tail protein [Burkholderia stagnalis]RQQ47912.1 phage tail protein [Burkholderia stagnalis]RQQ59562.1 phage tail protein [Burkholderia stagnalis]RQQ60016.1 phage tail protein [Burkholderia stagnalis]RQQ74672.1 phage tail protein [Burkholderia stagnalis]RQQ80263.1 phage tail protein [Burkholderia stagnalis]
MKNVINQLHEPSLVHRFRVSVFIKRIPSPLDMNFAQVSGLGRSLSVSEMREGGDSMGALRLTERVNAGSLVLQHGMMVATPMMMLFDQALRNFTRTYVTAMVLLLNGKGLPVCSWTLTDAIPTKWDTGNLDASSDQVLINSLELAYRELHWMGVRR